VREALLKLAKIVRQPEGEMPKKASEWEPELAG
jgi:hypothetical protein